MRTAHVLEQDHALESTPSLWSRRISPKRPYNCCQLAAMDKPSPWKSRGRRPDRPAFDALPPIIPPSLQPASGPNSGRPKPYVLRHSSWSPHRQPLRSRNVSDSAQAVDLTLSVDSATSEDISDGDDAGFGRKVQIDMKGLVGDAVGNVCTRKSSCYFD
jgi:hypothetical protein